VGVHATTMEQTGPLVKEGVSTKLFNTRHGFGKGNGFCIIPASGGKVTSGLIKDAKGWGSHVVAVFLPEAAAASWANDTDNVETLEEDNNDNDPLYYMFGKSEAVIPPSLCPDVRIVVDPADISMGDTEYEAEPYGEDLDEFDFLKLL
jgi:hypothetical protein